MRVWEILQEAVGGNYLYHGVPEGKTVSNILKSGFIKPMAQFEFDCDDPDDKETCPDVISLSRDQFLRFPYGNAVAQFVVDKDALKKAGIIAKPQVGTNYFKQEAEERVFKPIPVKAPYVVAIQYDPSLKVPKSIIDKVQATGIKIEPWKTINSRQDEPEYDVNYSKSSYSTDDETDPAVVIRNILDKGTDPLPDWRNLYLLKMADSYGIYYKIPGWTHGLEIQPFRFLDDENFAKRILAQLQQLTKAGKSIRPIMNKYAQKQFGKDWKQGRYQIRPGDKGYKHPDEDNKDRTE